jgi:hypothetical protein
MPKVSDTIPGAAVDPHLEQTLSDGLNITGIAEAQSSDPHQNPNLCLGVPQPFQPAVKSLATEDLDHVSTLAYNKRSADWSMHNAHHNQRGCRGDKISTAPGSCCCLSLLCSGFLYMLGDQHFNQ